MSELLREYAAFKDRVRGNPSTGADWVSQFLRHLDANKKLKPYTEGEWFALGRERGLSSEQVCELIERAAGWVAEEQQDITDQAVAGWPEDRKLLEKATTNPVSGKQSRGSQFCPMCSGIHSPAEPCPDSIDDSDEEDNPGVEKCTTCGCGDQKCRICDACGGCDCCCGCPQENPSESCDRCGCEDQGCEICDACKGCDCCCTC
jgi:hypothetical protein